MKLAIEMFEEDRTRLAQVADRLDVSVESLAEAAIRALVAGPSDAFEEAAEQLLDKNEELYERLS